MIMTRSPQLQSFVIIFLSQMDFYIRKNDRSKAAALQLLWKFPFFIFNQRQERATK
jgi:hypothetical protein